MALQQAARFFEIAEHPELLRDTDALTVEDPAAIYFEIGIRVAQASFGGRDLFVRALQRARNRVPARFRRNFEAGVEAEMRDIEERIEGIDTSIPPG